MLKQLEPASKLVATMKIFRHIEMLTANVAADTLDEFAAIVLGRGDHTASRDFFKFISSDFKKYYDPKHNLHSALISNADFVTVGRVFGYLLVLNGALKVIECAPGKLVETRLKAVTQGWASASKVAGGNNELGLVFDSVS